MADASFAQTSFLGGMWSKYAQGRWDRPDYRTALNDCLNSIPTEQGALTRRPGTQYANTTRNGQQGRVLSFDFKQAAPYTIEFTSGILRFRNGPNLVTTNDDSTLTAISAGNPAQITHPATNWQTGDSVKFANLGTQCPLLQNRVFTISVFDGLHFSIFDSITGAAIDGSTLGAYSGGATVQHILEVPSPYTGTLWRDVRMVQTELTAVLLHPKIAPYTLTAVPPGVGQTFFSFTLAKSNLLDGPYLDPPTNGAQITPSAVNGVVTLTLSAPTFVAAKAYSKGDFVNQTGVNYISIADQNQGNTPPNASFWTPASAGLMIGPNGFQGSDINRLIRIQDSANNWTWGKITSVANLIPGTLAGSTNIGTMTSNGGLAAAFDSITAQTAANSAAALAFTVDPSSAYVGKNYTGAAAQVIGQATFWPPTDSPAVAATKSYTTTTLTFQAVNPAAPAWQQIGSSSQNFTVTTTVASLVINLRAKNSAPGSSSDGTLLGQAQFPGGSPLTIISNDQVSNWLYVWLELVASGVDASVPATQDNRVPNPPTVAQASAGTKVTQISSALTGISFNMYCAEAQFFNPSGTGAGNAVSFQILGNALADTSARSVWRLGVYSDTTGWPTCGTYHEGRLWLSGSLPNRIDSSFSNQQFLFAPTVTNGQVLDASAISAVFNAQDVNAVFWMVPDQLGIVCGTQAGDWLVQASNNNNVLTPTSIQAHRYSKLGCANIEPRRMDRILIFVQRFQRKLYEYFADVFSGKFTAQNITWAMRNLTSPGIAEIAVQQELAPIVWARCSNGSLFGVTYKRENPTTTQPPNFSAGHRHTLGSGRIVESITVGPSIDGTLDSLMMVTNDASSNIRHVEILTAIFEEGTAETAAWFLDDAINPSSTTTSSITPAPYGGLTINGLWHLNGKVVTVFAGGIDCGDFLVASGSITVPYGDGISAGTGNGLFTAAFAATATIVIGFTYTSQGQVVRAMTPQESGARNGPALGKKRRSMQYAVLLDNTAGLSFGTDFTKLLPANFKNPNGSALTTGQTFSGVYWDVLQDDYTFDSMFCWQTTRPYSATVVAIEQFLHTQDK